jgi:hypothetical protein
MKRLGLLFSTIIVVLFSASAVAGVIPGSKGAPTNPVAQPDSRAFGKSLGEWMGIYWRQFLAGNLANGNTLDVKKNVALLPTSCALSACIFNVQVRPGTALVLPLAGYLGFTEDDVLPDEWWGDRNHIFTETTLDGLPLAEPNAAYYTGPIKFDPPISFTLDDGSVVQVVLHQSIGVVIKPLTPGVHTLLLHAEFVDFGIAYDNTWHITVLPPGKK